MQSGVEKIGFGISRMGGVFRVEGLTTKQRYGAETYLTLQTGDIGDITDRGHG